ncbi:MAG: translation initiation factor IF-2 N-terminal domain-containing protein, partial [[Ruminococcus] lactaris]
MAKARVYELAKELGVGNKEILEQLKKKNVEVKNHMSTVEDNVAEEIRRENAGRNEEPAKAEPAAEKAGEKDSTVPKKKNLAFVVRPQNSRNSSRLQGNKRPGANQGRGAAQGNARGGENRPVRAAGAEGRPVRTERAAQAGTRQEKTDRAERTVRTEKPAQTERTVRTERPAQTERMVRTER